MPSTAASFQEILSLPPIWAAQIGSVRSYPARDPKNPTFFPLDPQFYITNPPYDLKFPLNHEIKPECMNDGLVKRFNGLDVDIGNPVAWNEFVDSIVKNVEEDLGLGMKMAEMDRKCPGGRLEARMREVVVVKPGGRFPTLVE